MKKHFLTMFPPPTPSNLKAKEIEEKRDALVEAFYQKAIALVELEKLPIVKEEASFYTFFFPLTNFLLLIKDFMKFRKVEDHQAKFPPLEKRRIQSPKVQGKTTKKSKKKKLRGWEIWRKKNLKMESLKNATKN